MAQTATALAALRTRDEYPSEFHQYNFGPFASAAVTATTSPLFVLTRNCDIESISLSMGTKPGQACLCTFVKAASGTAIGSGTALNTAADLDLNQLTNATPVDVALTAGANTELTAGTTIGVTLGTATSLVGLVIAIRTKNRRYRATTSGSKQWTS